MTDDGRFYGGAHYPQVGAAIFALESNLEGLKGVDFLHRKEIERVTEIFDAEKTRTDDGPHGLFLYPLQYIGYMKEIILFRREEESRDVVRYALLDDVAGFYQPTTPREIAELLNDSNWHWEMSLARFVEAVNIARHREESRGGHRAP